MPIFRKYQELVAGTNIDPRSLLSNDYFNHFNTVIMMYGMLGDAPELLDEIDQWSFVDYIGHFKASGLDFAPLAIEAYPHAPEPLRKRFEMKIEQMRKLVEESRSQLREILQKKEMGRFNETAKTVTRQLQALADEGGAIVHGHDESLDQSAIDKLF